MRSVVIGLALLAIGCAAKGPEWARTGATEQELHRDTYECQKENSAPSFQPPILGGYQVRVIEDLYRSCMRARGWTRTR